MSALMALKKVIKFHTVQNSPYIKYKTISVIIPTKITALEVNADQVELIKRSNEI